MRKISSGPVQTWFSPSQPSEPYACFLPATSATSATSKHSHAFGLRCTSNVPHSKWNLQLRPGQLLCKAYGTGTIYELDGHYFSFKTGGNPSDVVDRFEARQVGDRVTYYRNGPVGSRERVDSASANAMEAYEIRGNQLHGPVSATIQANGDICYNHGYTSRKEVSPPQSLKAEAAKPPQQAGHARADGPEMTIVPRGSADQCILGMAGGGDVDEEVPTGWYENDFDDSQWKPPTESISDSLPRKHGLSPGVWCEKHPRTFYRITPTGSYTLDASPASEDPLHSIPVALCARTVTKHAAEMLQSSGIKCLDLRSNPRLGTLPVEDLCRIVSLARLECAGCVNVASPPMEVADNGGADVMEFLRECCEDGALNEDMVLFFLGAGESGKTSLKDGLMNKGGKDKAAPIGVDTRTVGMDVLTWHTTDLDGNPLEIKMGDAGGQDVYLSVHELFVLDRAAYIYAWRPREGSGDGMQNKCEDVITWLNLLQSRVPGVSVIPVVTHIDCVSSSTLEEQCAIIMNAFQGWVSKQTRSQKSDDMRVVRVLNGGNSFRVNCLRGDGIAELRSAVLQEVARTKGYHEPLPTKWINLRRKVRERATQNFMTWEDFAHLACEECKIPKSMLLSVTSFLHETLELRFFGISVMRRRKTNLEDFLTVLLGTRSEGHVHDARALFDAIDEDSSGAIDETELRKFLQQRGLDDAKIKLMMQSADDDNSGEIDFEEFRDRFAKAKLAAKGNDVLASTVYLNVEWMIDILKGIIRHDHAALHEFLRDARERELILQARRLRVQGIIGKDLLDNNLLWPGMPSPFWDRVAEDTTQHFKYEKDLWADSAGACKKVVENESGKAVAIGLLEGFKMILPDGQDRSAYRCPAIVPKHNRNTTDNHSLDASSSGYWRVCTYSELPAGFWDALFMEICSSCTSGSTSNHIQAFFLLSAKIQVKRTRDKDDHFRIEFRASTAVAFEVAKTALGKVLKFYPGMALWEVSNDEISAQDKAKINEPAQVLVMTAASLLRKKSGLIEAFNEASARVEGVLGPVKQQLEQEAATKENDDVEGMVEKVSTRQFEKSLRHIKSLQSRLGSPTGDHFTGSILLPDISEDLGSLVEHVILPDYRNTMRMEKRRCVALGIETAPVTAMLGFGARVVPEEARRSQIPDPSTTLSPNELDKSLFSALKEAKIDEARKWLEEGADPSYTSPTCCFVPYTPWPTTPTSPKRNAVIRVLCVVALLSLGISLAVISQDQPWVQTATEGQSLGNFDSFRNDDIVIRVQTSVPNQRGCLFEAGGQGQGTFIGVVEMPNESLQFRFTAGDGGKVGGASDDNTAALVIPLPDPRIPQDAKTHQLVMTIDVHAHAIQLVVDGILVATAKSAGAFPHNQWSDGDEACVGKGCGDVAMGGDPSPWGGEFKGPMQFRKSSEHLQTIADRHAEVTGFEIRCAGGYPESMQGVGIMMTIFACGCALFFTRRLRGDFLLQILTKQACCCCVVAPLIYFFAIPMLIALISSSPECGGALWWLGCIFFGGVGLSVMIYLGLAMVKTCCYGTHSSVAEANKIDTLPDLLHSYGCNDPKLKISELTERRIEAGERLQKSMEQMEELERSFLEPFSQPRSLLPRDYMQKASERVESKSLSNTPEIDDTERGAPETVNTQQADGNASTDIAWPHEHPKISAEDIQGCWVCVCFPGFSAMEKRIAQGPDTLIHHGVCCPLFSAYQEPYDRDPDTNTFRKRRDKGDTVTYKSPGFVCFGVGCACRLCKRGQLDGSGYSQPNGGPRADQFKDFPFFTWVCCWTGQIVLCPLHFLSMLGCSSAIRCLARKGCCCLDPDMHHPLVNSSTPLSFAASHGQLHCVMELIAKGADPTLADDVGVTPLSEAEREHHDHVVKYLKGLQKAKRGEGAGAQTGTLEQLRQDRERRGLYARSDGILADATPTDALDFIETLFPAIDAHFEPLHGVSKEIYSPHSVFVGDAHVVLVLIDSYIDSSPEVLARFRELEAQGCKIIGVPMPGYVITDYGQWWPQKLSELKDHSLFLDCREREGWAAKMKEVMPQVQKFLQEGSPNPASSTPAQRSHPQKPGNSYKMKICVEEIKEADSVLLPGALGGSPQQHVGEIEAEGSAPRGVTARNLEDDSSDLPTVDIERGTADEAQPYFSSAEEMRECILPCPSCLRLGNLNPGGFQRDLCMLSFFTVNEDRGTNAKGMLFCFTCQRNVPVKEILPRTLFLSYNWGNDNSTQKIAIKLCKRVFIATEMPYWLDIDGGMGFGEELITEMREGVTGCEIVILMISDAFCNSANCLREFVHTANNRKYIVPLLVPDKGETRTGPSGWTGEYEPGDKAWWTHAVRICTCKDPDAPEKAIPWSYLAAFSPIDLRGEKLEKDGSLPDDSDPENEIITRIMSRFFRSQKSSND